MIIHQNSTSIDISGHSVVTVGSFDGVHRGHRKILSRLTEKAKEIDGNAVVVTFHPHPRHVLAHHGQPLFLLNTLEEKAQLLAESGIDHLVLVKFDEKFSSMSPEDYVEHFLIANFHPHTMVIGYDHRFGKERKGGFELMEQYSAAGHFDLEEIPAQELKEATISSTLIREKLLAGCIEDANQLLGYRYGFSGMVVEGNKLGRTIGFPTANLAILEPNKLIPGFGVYIVNVTIEYGMSFEAMMHIGNRPSIQDPHRSIEVHLLNFNDNLYGKQITVKILKKLREIQSFENLGTLEAQLQKDKQATIQFFSSST